MPAPMACYGFATVLAPKVEYPVRLLYRASYPTASRILDLALSLGALPTVAGGVTTDGERSRWCIHECSITAPTGM